MAAFTTRTDGTPDQSMVDMGAHYADIVPLPAEGHSARFILLILITILLAAGVARR